MRDNPVFAFASLYDIWSNPAGTTLSIITTAANSLMAPVHNRMTVILRQDDEMHGLSRAVLPVDELQRILVPYPAEGMVAYPVSERVNSPAADDRQVIEPVVVRRLLSAENPRCQPADPPAGIKGRPWRGRPGITTGRLF